MKKILAVLLIFLLPVNITFAQEIQEGGVWEDVPKRALLLLRDHTKGQNERIFTYEKGEQVWR